MTSRTARLAERPYLVVISRPRWSAVVRLSPHLALAHLGMSVFDPFHERHERLSSDAA